MKFNLFLCMSVVVVFFWLSFWRCKAWNRHHCILCFYNANGQCTGPPSLLISRCVDVQHSMINWFRFLSKNDQTTTHHSNQSCETLLIYLWVFSHFIIIIVRYLFDCCICHPFSVFFLVFICRTQCFNQKPWPKYFLSFIFAVCVRVFCGLVSYSFMNFWWLNELSFVCCVSHFDLEYVFFFISGSFHRSNTSWKKMRQKCCQL